MADIKAFRGLRFDTQKAGAIEELTCPPYDIISEEQRRAFLSRNPNNVIRLELPKEGEDPYAAAGKTLNSWIESGVLRRDEKPSLYIYEEAFTVKGKPNSIKGLVCLVGLSPFSDGVVLPHEETLSKAKTDRFNLMKATHCNFSQIYSLYHDDTGDTGSAIERNSEGRPDQEFTDADGLTHRLWAVTDPDEIAALTAQFKSRKVYIADGHHRYETALNFRNHLREQGVKPGVPSDNVMMILVDMAHPGLVVFPTHRIVRGLKSFDPDQAIEGCGEYFDCTDKTDINTMEDELESLYNEGKKAFGFYAGGHRWTLLVLKDLAAVRKLVPDQSAATQGLDVTVLHSLILERIFGINKENMANQINLAYIKQFDDVVAAVNRGEAQCGFILNPTRVTEIRDVAAAGEKMPQKSTYFYPKIITGMVMNQLKD